MAEKKHVFLTVRDKLDALERLDKGESVIKIAKELKVGETTVRNWRKNRVNLQEYSIQLDSDETLKLRRSMKKPKLEILDDALWVWFMQERRRGTPLSGPLIKEKAILLHEKMKTNEEFTASDGWLTRWKQRHGIHVLSICGEKLSADDSAARKFKEEFLAFVKSEQFSPEQVYNMDETGLNYKLLPTKTFAGNFEKSATGFKTNKDRVTIAVCSNASGTHKLPLFVIGKSTNPRAFKNVNRDALPVYYRSQTAAWMNSNLCQDWFFSQFVPQVEKYLKNKNLPSKAVLLLDNAPSHPNAEIMSTPNIKTKFLPPLVTSILQPMDQGVIECLKRRYRKKLVSTLLQHEDKSLIESLKLINIKDVVYMAAQAWDEIPASTLVKSWEKLWPEVANNLEMSTDDCTTESLLHVLHQLPGGENIEETDLQELVQSDAAIDGEFYGDEEILHLVQSDNLNPTETLSDDEDQAKEQVSKISHSDAQTALDTVLCYVEQQPCSSAVDIMCIQKWKEYAARNRFSSAKQKKITDFFKT